MLHVIQIYITSYHNDKLPPLPAKSHVVECTNSQNITCKDIYNEQLCGERTPIFLFCQYVHTFTSDENK